MRSPAAAIAWEFRARHRWGLTLLLAYIVALAVVRVAFEPVRFTSDEAFAFSVLVPLSAAFLYVLAVFTFGLRGDIASRESMYPARMFALPVKTAALVGWPMLYGTVAVAALWFVLRFLSTWPAGVEVPKWWPAFLAASILAWTQALTWMPYPLRGMRVIVSVLVLTGIDVVVFIALQFRPPESLMVMALAPTIPLAYFAARYALGRARRGDVPEWRLPFAESAGTRLKPFASAPGAQLWFEWRRFGRVLPALVAIVLPSELGILALFRETESIVFTILFVVLLTPPFLAMFVAASVRNVNAFETTRPLGNLPLIGAKLNAALWSTLATWALVLAAIPCALRWSGAWAAVAHRARVLSSICGVPRSTLVVVLAIVILIASTWKQLVQSLYLGMSGREWMPKASVFLGLALVTASVPALEWLSRHRDALRIVWNGFPWLLGALALAKIAGAAVLAARLHDRHLVSDRMLLTGALGWNAAVFAVYGALAWALPAFFFRAYFLTLVAILAVPLVRLAAAPLALEWNRHR